MKKGLIGMAVAGVMVVAGAVWGQDNFGITKIGQLFDYWSDPKNMVVDGNYAYLATYSTGLRIVDLTDPGALTEVGKYDEVGTFWHICKDGGRVFVSTLVFDVSDPTRRPILAKSL